MLVKTNQAFPNDIEKMIELLQEINQSEKLMLQRTQKERTAYQKYVKNLIARK